MHETIKAISVLSLVFLPTSWISSESFTLAFASVKVLLLQKVDFMMPACRLL